MTPWDRRVVEHNLKLYRHALQWLSLVQKQMTLDEAIKHLQEKCEAAGLELAEDDALEKAFTAKSDAAIKAINTEIRSAK